MQQGLKDADVARRERERHVLERVDLVHPAHVAARDVVDLNEGSVSVAVHSATTADHR